MAKPKYPQSEALELARLNAIRLLGLHEHNTPEERAKAMGFESGWGHGSPRSDITEMQPSRTGAAGPGAYATQHMPEVGLYAGGKQGATSYPLMVKRANALDVSTSNPFEHFGVKEDKDLAKILRKAKKTGMVLKQPPTAEWLKDLDGLEYPAREHYVSTHPHTFRSRFAAFDPARAHEAGLSYAEGGRTMTPKDQALQQMAKSKAAAMLTSDLHRQYALEAGHYPEGAFMTFPAWLAHRQQNKPVPQLAEGGEPMTALGRVAAGQAGANLIKQQPQMKASEALGQLMEKGFKKTTTTQADRTKVGGGNIGGAAFSAISEAHPEYAGRVWGVGEPATAARLTNLTDPETAWTTMLGSANQLKTNPIVFGKLRRAFLAALKEGKMTPELEAKFNKNLELTFGEGANVRDPKIWDAIDTFEKRSAMADLMMGQGVEPGKGGVAMGGEKSGKGVIFKPTDILKAETERSLMHPEHGGEAPTFAAGPRLFSLSGTQEQRPDLHPGFPTLLHGKDLGMNVKPTPTEVYLPEWHAAFKKANPTRKGPGYYDLALGVKGQGLPSQALHEAYIKHLMREGFAEGGTAHYAEGGEVKAEDKGPSQDEMMAHIMLNGMSRLKDVGANEAPNMKVKTYAAPSGGPGLPVGGVDFQPEAKGQQMLPGQPPAPGGMPPAPGGLPPAPGQPPQAGGPPPGAPGQPPALPPPGASQSNILQMTPQGQAMAAMKARPPTGMPPRPGMPRMAEGGSIKDYITITERPL